MKWHLGYSVKEDTLAAIEEACQTFRNTQPELVLFFSDSIRFERVAVLLHGRGRGASPLASSGTGSGHAERIHSRVREKFFYLSNGPFCLGTDLSAFTGLAGPGTSCCTRIRQYFPYLLV